QPTYFAHGLARAYMNPDTYRTARQFQWLRRLGEAFATKDRRRLGTIVNKDENHWVGLAIDCEEETHLGVKFRWMDLPIPSQNDVHSCGLLAYFALANFFDGQRFPLPKATSAKDTRQLRAKN
ncbi:hypothetical protein B0H14DRAFT_2985652, partial [Mycena olivaceomarginata]